MREDTKKMRFKNMQAAKLSVRPLFPDRTATIDVRHNKKREEKCEGQKEYKYK